MVNETLSVSLLPADGHIAYKPKMMIALRECRKGKPGGLARFVNHFKIYS